MPLFLPLKSHRSLHACKLEKVLYSIKYIFVAQIGEVLINGKCHQPYKIKGEVRIPHVNLPGQAKNATIATIATIYAKIRGSSYFDHIACIHTK